MFSFVKKRISEFDLPVSGVIQNLQKKHFNNEMAQCLNDLSLDLNDLSLEDFVIEKPLVDITNKKPSTSKNVPLKKAIPKNTKKPVTGG